MALIKTFTTDLNTGVTTASVEFEDGRSSIVGVRFNPAVDGHEQVFTQSLHDAATWTSENLYFAAGELQVLPQRTAPYHTWDWDALQWADKRTLDVAKQARWSRIKEFREDALTSPLTTPFGVFDAAASAQKSITDAVLMLQTLSGLGTPTTIDFTLADNTTATLTTEQMVQVGLLLGQRTQQVYAKARELRARIEAATTKEEVEAVAWS
jgi:hypothetical protein